jgi:putative transposase
LADNLVALIKRVAKENLTWGAERIRGGLLKLGIKVSKSTIQKYMKGVRESLTSKQTWATFLRDHAHQIWACDFLQTYDVFFRTVFVFVIIELGSRRVGATRSP